VGLASATAQPRLMVVRARHMQQDKSDPLH